MKYFSAVSATVAVFLLPLQLLAQIQVSFPTTRAVLQRNASNQATIRVVGSYTVPLTRVEARLVAREGQGTSTDWSTIQNNPTGGVYAGDLTGQGGWYNLEVRGFNSDQQVANTIVERVGIGEVFIIAGQSNAQGVHQSAPNPRNDRVNCVNYRYPDTGFPNDPPVPEYTLLDNTPGFTIAPRGVGSWCWGLLGDLLVKRLNVPIMFFNAAFTGTPSRNWRESAPEGGQAFGVFNGAPFAGRQPYINLKIALQFYANMLGARAVLWHQGEGDNLLSTPPSSYVSDMQLVINQSRQDYGRNIPWVFARATYFDFGGASPAIIGAQNQIIATVPNVFPGPSTDGIQIPRYRAPLFDQDRVHFDFDGLVEVANLWNASLTDAFFQNATPIAPSPSPTLSVACAPNNNLALGISGGFSSVQWSTGETSATVTKGAGGPYRAKVKDSRGNTFFTNAVQVSAPPVAAVADNRPPSICVGSSLNLTTNYDNVTWLNQQTNATVSTSRTFAATTAGAYFVRYRDVSGCDFTSNVLNLAVNPLPATPTIANERPTTFCQGDNTVLRASSDNVRYNWNSGQADKAISVTSSGTYFLTVTDQNGCTSAQSNSITVTVNPVPAKPTVAASGPTTFCADRTITLTAPEATAYRWSNGQTTRALTLNQSGNFSVQVGNQFNCFSETSDAIQLLVNPLPATPGVSAAGATTFCEGNQVTLNAASNLDVVWSSGQTDKAITVSSTGNFAVQARDQNGCLSPYSSVISVRVNPLPAAPTIQASPSSVICEGDRTTLRVFGPYTVLWNTGATSASIVTGQAGNYVARVRDVNGCVSPESRPLTVELRPLPPAPTVNVIGTYTLEAVSSTNGTEFRWRRDSDSLAFQTAIIKAPAPGNYTARASTVYSGTLTCFSQPSAPVSFTIDVSNRGLSIYPNPNPDKRVTIETQANLTNAAVTIYTLTGQVVFTGIVPVFDERKEINMTGYPSGPYVLRVQSGNFDVSKRIQVGL